MSIQAISRSVYQLARDFFRYEALKKSGNKRYNEHAPVSAEKFNRREDRLYRANKWVIRNRAEQTPGKTAYEYGKWVYRQGPKAAGNCVDMSCVALHLFQVARQVTGAASFPVSFVGLEDPGDHAFLIAGYLPPVVFETPYLEASTMSLHTLCRSIPEIAESYVVDVWAGVFCPTIDYPFELSCKLIKWSLRGKEILTTPGWLDPADPTYAYAQLNSRVFRQDPEQAWEPKAPQ